MLRHVIAPAHSYAQIPNVILRHPRLSSDAKNLLNWQLSLPSGDEQCLSDTATKAGIRKCAFQNAKRQLLNEGYVHQWTVRKDGGRFATIQLICNTPLSPKEALAVRDGLRPTPAGARLTPGPGDGQPSVGVPTAGEPTGPSVGRQPEKNTWENTTQPTGQADASGPAAGPAESAEPAEPAEPASGADREGTGEPPHAPAGGTANPPEGTYAAGEALLLSLAKSDPRLAMPVRTASRWAPLAAKWLDGGLAPLRVRHLLTEGLDTARKPLGALHWRLQHALPDVEPPTSPAPDAPKQEPRTTAMRECRTRHIQPRLFTPRPGSDEKLCPACRCSEPPPPPMTELSGYAEYAAARPRRNVRRKRRS